MFRRLASSDRLSERVSTGIWWELVRQWCRTRSRGESPVTRWGHNVHLEWRWAGYVLTRLYTWCWAGTQKQGNVLFWLYSCSIFGGDLSEKHVDSNCCENERKPAIAILSTNKSTNTAKNIRHVIASLQLCNARSICIALPLGIVMSSIICLPEDGHSATIRLGHRIVLPIID